MFKCILSVFLHWSHSVCYSGLQGVNQKYIKYITCSLINDGIVCQHLHRMTACSTASRARLNMDEKEMYDMSVEN